MAIFIAMLIILHELKNMLGFSQKFLLLAPLYPIIPCFMLIYLNQSPEYKILLYYLFILVFTFDSASYLAGKTYGKFWTTTKIVPKISPGKSWQGACGGYLITTSLLLMILTAQEKKINEWDIDLLSAMICTIAFAGDIFDAGYSLSSVNRTAANCSCGFTYAGPYNRQKTCLGFDLFRTIADGVAPDRIFYFFV